MTLIKILHMIKSNIIKAFFSVDSIQDAFMSAWIENK